MLKGLGGLGDMAKMMKKAQEMQGKMTQIQDDLEQVEVHAEAGAGLVKITSNAKGQVKSLEIDPSILVASEKEVVEDLIVAALKEAMTKGQEAKQKELSKLTEGLNLPPGMKLPF